MSYDAVVMDGELKDALQDVMGVETLETEELSGFTLKIHSGLGLQSLVQDGKRKIKWPENHLVASDIF